MKVLVVGGHGFLGQHVVRELQSRGHDTIAQSRKDGLDLCDLESTRQVLQKIKPDVVVNCAAHVGSVHYVTEFAATVVDENLRIITNLFRAIHECLPTIRLINPISNCSYPGDADVHTEKDWWNGPVHRSVLSYGVPRRVMGVLAECYAMQYKMKTVNYLVSNAYGPGDYTDPARTHALNGMILRMLQARAEKKPSFEIWGTGKPMREWVFIKDVARMLADAVQSEAEIIAPINVAQNKAYSIGDIAGMIQQAIGYPGKLVFNTSYQDGAMRKVLDDQLFRARYPDFVFTPIRQGIEETVEYYQSVLRGKS